jgi:hypothetical protein
MRYRSKIASKLDFHLFNNFPSTFNQFHNFPTKKSVKFPRISPASSKIPNLLIYRQFKILVKNSTFEIPQQCQQAQARLASKKHQ